MDGALLFFREADHAQVEAAARPLGYTAGTVTAGDRHCYLWRYMDLDAEFEATEKSWLEDSLGGSPRSAFTLFVRHGPSARLALEVAARLMQQFSASLLYDDEGAGHIWAAEAVVDCWARNDSADLYTLIARPLRTTD